MLLLKVQRTSKKFKTEAVRVQSVLAFLMLKISILTSDLPEEHDVRLWFMDGVVNPTSRLLHSQSSPLKLEEEEEGGEKTLC